MWNESGIFLRMELGILSGPGALFCERFFRQMSKVLRL